MKRVHTGVTLADTTHLKNLLELSGIDSFIKNTYLGSGAGDLPVFDVSPELWVFEDAYAAHAEAIVREALRPQSAVAPDPWLCRQCGESNEGQFAVCWRCGVNDARG
jgi:hypothetical protein